VQIFHLDLHLSRLSHQLIFGFFIDHVQANLTPDFFAYFQMYFISNILLIGQLVNTSWVKGDSCSEGPLPLLDPVPNLVVIRTKLSLYLMLLLEKEMNEQLL